jgi:hypothetical protein
MREFFDYPLLLGLFSLALLVLSTWLGATVLRRRGTSDRVVHDDLGVVVGATLTLLGLIIGFTFSMAITRYDQRKNLEEEEANAIGTAYARADLLPEADGAKLKSLLRGYLELRIRHYTTRDAGELRELDARQSRLQSELWNAVRGPAASHPTPIVALAVASINDVLNAQSYVQAAWWNRIPPMAWALMLVVGVFCNMLMGYGAKRPKEQFRLLLVLPVLVAIAVFLIADIDAPRSGVVRVYPQNLAVTLESLRGP